MILNSKLNAFYSPEALRWDSPDTFAAINQQDQYDDFTYNVSLVEQLFLTDFSIMF